MWYHMKTVVECPSGDLLYVKDVQRSGQASIICPTCGFHGYIKDFKERSEFPPMPD